MCSLTWALRKLELSLLSRNPEAVSSTFSREIIELQYLIPLHIVQGALEWLEDNQDKSLDEISAAATSSTKDDDDPTAEPPALKSGEVAKSLECEICGKKLRSEAQAEFHASKSGHDQFKESTEEIAPLTEAEKKAKLEEMRRALAEKRAGMSDQDKIDKKRNEVSITSPNE